MGDIDADVREIKEEILLLSRKMDLLLDQRETLAMMKLSERSLSSFLADEPDLYTLADCKAVIR